MRTEAERTLLATVVIAGLCWGLGAVLGNRLLAALGPAFTLAGLALTGVVAVLASP